MIWGIAVYHFIILYYITGLFSAIKLKSIFDKNHGEYFERNGHKVENNFNLENFINPLVLWTFIYNLFVYYRMVRRISYLTNQVERLLGEIPEDTLEYLRKEYGTLFIKEKS